MVTGYNKEAYTQLWQREDRAKFLENKGYKVSRWTAFDVLGYPWYCFQVLSNPVEIECAKHGCEPGFGNHKDNCRSFSIYLKSR